MPLTQEYKDGYNEACSILEAEILRLENVGKITGDPNTYWKLQSVKKVEMMLTDHLALLESGYLEKEAENVET